MLAHGRPRASSEQQATSGTPRFAAVLWALTRAFTHKCDMSRSNHDALQPKRSRSRSRLERVEALGEPIAIWAICGPVWEVQLAAM